MLNNELSEQSEELVEKMEELPDKEKEILMARLEMTQSPLPDPITLEKYNLLYPGAAKEIIDNGVAEGKHRRELEKRAMEAKIKMDNRRYILAFILSLLGLSLAFALVLTGHPIGGSIFGGLGIVALVGAFLPNNNVNTNIQDNQQENSET